MPDDKSDDPWVEAAESTWKSRRGATRKLFEVKLAFAEAEAEAKLQDLKAAEERRAAGMDESDAIAAADAENLESTITSTAFVVAILAIVLRVGGRAALLGLVGVDPSGDEAVKESIESFVTSARSVGGEAGLLAFYLGGFVVAKTLCLDALTFALALSSGVLFGGVVEGTLIATTCATVGSSVAFWIAREGRPGLRAKLLRLLRREPKLRALEDSVVENGFQTVLVLRLAPILPIPISAYNYLYGATEIQFAKDFVPAMFLGSLKPYAFDSYLGVFGKSIVDAGASDTPNSSFANDLPLLGIFAVFIAVGSLSSQLASKTWAAMEAANTKEEEPMDAVVDDEDWIDVLELRSTGPWRFVAAGGDFVAEREPEWSAELRVRAKRARFALAYMAAEEFFAARRDMLLKSDEGQQDPGAKKGDKRATDMIKLAPSFLALQKQGIEPDPLEGPIPKGGDKTLDIPSSLLESTLYSWVILRALFDEKTLADEIKAYNK